MKKKYFFIVILLVMVIITLFYNCLENWLVKSGFVYSKDDKKYMKQLEVQAEKNAINYIQDKYGFYANVVSTKVEKVTSSPMPGFTPRATGNVYVYLSENDNEFCVYISGEEKTNKGIDNYQYEEITSDFITMINNKLNLKPYKYLVRYWDGMSSTGDKNSKNGLINELYTKNNLKTIIDNNDFNLLIEYINEPNLEYIKTNNLLSEFEKTKIMLINYYSLELYNNVSINNYYMYETEFIKNAVNIESAYVYDDVEKYYKFNVKEFDGNYYYVERDNFEANVEIEETTISDVSNWIGRGVLNNAKQISDAYLVKGNYKKLYIYIPLNKINGYDLENIDVGIECYGKFHTRVPEVVGKYLVFPMYEHECDQNHDIKFALMYSH